MLFRSNRGDNFGIDYFEVTQKNGWRLNASRAFIKPAAKRGNLTIITGATVDRLSFSGLTCNGINFVGGGKVHRAFARHEVLLAAGSIGRVQILERSGIGNSEILKSLGISPIKHLPGVGENLQDHLQLRMAFKVQLVRREDYDFKKNYGDVERGLMAGRYGDRRYRIHEPAVEQARARNFRQQAGERLPRQRNRIGLARFHEFYCVIDARNRDCRGIRRSLA